MSGLCTFLKKCDVGTHAEAAHEIQNKSKMQETKRSQFSYRSLQGEDNSIKSEVTYKQETSNNFCKIESNS